MTVHEEDAEQQALFEWAAYQKCKYPELECMYHIPNEGKRSPQTGAKLKRMGLSPGVPDICLPVARGGYSALYIELKRTKGAGSATTSVHGSAGSINGAALPCGATAGKWQKE